nr:sensor histidine kinase [Actinomycetota bacterium]
VAVAAWFVGDSVRVRRVYVAGLAEQAAQRQREILERAQRSVAEERLEIARELHDVVAHSLSVIAVQSGVGRHVIETNPKEAKSALAAVESTSRAALDELRRMLGVLRRDEQRPASLDPAPGVATLARLADHVRGAGVPVALVVDERAVRALSPSAELSVYRIVQEALTNVVKHAGPAEARVAVTADAGTLVVEVADTGRGGAPRADPDGSTHHGIVGMRERVLLFGGTLEVGDRSGGGFAVVARLPLDRVATA